MTSYSYQKHSISEAERLWLGEVGIAKGTFDRRIAKVRLRDKVPADFDPDKIDQRLCHEGKLTFVGLWHVDRSNELFVATDLVINVVRELIIEAPGINGVTAPDLAKRTGLAQTLVAKTLGSLSELGTFNNGGMQSPDGFGYSTMSLAGAYAYDEYLAYRSLDDLLERFYVTRGRPPTHIIGTVLNLPTAHGLMWPTNSIAPSEGIDRKSVKINTAFVLMAIDPSKPELVDVYAAIKDICKEFGITAYRADEIQHQDRITDRILQEIETCEYLIADLSYERPNVYYEVGYAHAMNKKPILYRRSDTRLHFDLQVHNVPEYKNATELRDHLRLRFSAILGRDPKSPGSQS